MLKKGIIFGMSLLITSITYAGGFYDCPDKDAVCKKPKFGFSLTGLYLQAYSLAIAGDAESLDAPWDWGGMIEGNYYFDNGSDLTINWLHYYLDYIGTDIDSGIGVLDAKFTEKLNVVTAELGHTFDLSSKSTFRLSGGLHYYHLHGNSAYVNGQFFTSTYQGVGPRAGLNANFKVNELFSVFTNGAASILLGKANRSLPGDEFIRPSTTHTYSAIPEFEGKLGVSHERPFKQGTASFSAGWAVITYFNLIGKNREDLTLSGPFLEAKWRG